MLDTKKLFKSFIFLMLSVLVMNVSANIGKIPVIIDTDVAIDDWFAILYLAKHPNVDIKAITVTGAGEAHCPQGVANVKKLLNLANYSHIPVTCGPSNPLHGGHDYPDLWRKQVDSLLNIKLTDPKWPATKTSVTQIWQQVTKENPNNTIMLALGPLTNLAKALDENDSVLHKFQQIYIMGGAVTVPGNVKASAPEIDNETAEWNFFADPLAAKKVFAANLAITLVPLDATNKVPLNLSFIAQLKEAAISPSAEFVLKVMEKNQKFAHDEGWYFWDPLAAAISVEPKLAVIEPMPIIVSLEPLAQSGRTKLSTKGNVINIAIDADEQKFKARFINILNGKGISK